MPSPHDDTRPRILFVAQHLPVPVRGGSSQRSHLIVEALNSFASVDILAFGPPEVAPFLEGHGYRVAGVVPFDGNGLLAKLRKVCGLFLPAAFRYRPRADALRTLSALWHSGRYDLVIGRYLSNAARAGIADLPVSIVDIDDLESQKILSWAALQSNAFVAAGARLSARRVQQAEQRLASKLSRIWLSAADDVEGGWADNIDLVPNIPYYPPADLGPSPSSGAILFVASFDYRVNAGALDHFLKTVWPSVRAARPDLDLHVVGGGLEPGRLALSGGDGVYYLGFVDDLAAHYAAALCSVVPIWQGGGTKIKILESLAFGRTCIVAAPSMRGYAQFLRDNEEVVVAADDGSFARAIVDLASDDERRRRLEEQGRSAVRKHYSRRRLAEQIAASVNRALAKRA